MSATTPLYSMESPPLVSMAVVSLHYFLEEAPDCSHLVAGFLTVVGMPRYFPDVGFSP
jgi:hypothetical protein